ncbi:hypothetical protein PQD71_gp232 [Kosakonia phage Kc263]|uniref:Uncharacterized protein n=1 Tax=Kosakonia phage Kc263 TaxID=2863194 RepID=A0AAE8BIN0_9CAUD|nr:hypothetical protein PQD71_gp232 [Kosakonia phage Kc263]QYN80094.1 hypothetical protein [Kosakonia phage Kc263]
MSEESSVDYGGMTLHEIYRVRNWASKSNNQSVLLQIKLHLNGRTGTGEIPTYPAVTLAEVLEGEPPEVWVVVDHAITDTPVAEQHAHILNEVIHARYDGKIKVSMHSGEIDGDRLFNYHVVLLALSHCFMVMKARGTNKAGTVVPYDSLR